MKTLIDNEDILVARDDLPKVGQLSLMKDMYVTRGTKADWDKLHELHYKAEGYPPGAKIWKCMLGEDQLVGVMIFSTVKMLNAGRNEVFKRFKPNTGGMDNKLINTTRAVVLNEMMLVNSRLVVDTMYRGAGIAYRFQNIACRMTGKRIIEFQSSMSKFNPFATKAGFDFVKPKRAAAYEKGLAFFRGRFDATPSDFVGIRDELQAMPRPLREKTIRELREFYYKNSAQEKTGANRHNGTSRVDEMPVDDLIKNIQQLAFASPLYGIYENPDFGTELPERVPLLAFDNQSVKEPLNLKV